MIEKQTDPSVKGEQPIIPQETILPEQTSWCLGGTVRKNDSEFRLLTIAKNESFIFEILKNSNHTISVNFGAEGKNCVRLLARLYSDENHILVVNYGHQYQLIVNGTLADEDWPRVPLNLQGGVCLHNRIDAVFRTEMPEPMLPFRVGEIATIDQIAHDGMNCFFGDCMPLWHDGIYHLFYLYDRRRHGSKCGYAAHRWAHISTRDLIHWKRHSFAVDLEKIEEATFRTGSVLVHKGRFYAFYVTLNNDGSPSPVTYSVSTDGEHFEKSGRGFYLGEEYDNIGVRDPNVFEDETGLLHMFLSTKYQSADGSCKGCILHFTAQDVDSWVMDEKPFLTIDQNEYPECSDYFRWNGRYYFSYCVHSVSHYMVSDEPFTGFQYRPEQLLGGNGFVVPKSAAFYNRRIAAGFSWTPYFGYAGEPVFLELFQQTDGTLEFRIPAELL